ncbi:Protease 4 [Alphaproteobacteria bacterium SO-S41]|nr:Protease 4 [Alphaproteobacteria bacterium SO-S41]
MFAFLAAIFRWIGRMFRNAFAVLGTLVALVIVLLILDGIWTALTDKGIPPNTVLAIDARGGFDDAPTPTVFGARPMSFIDIIFALKKAGDDPRVKGLVLRVGSGGIAGAHAQELKEAIENFRAKGENRFVIAQAGNFAGPGIGQYYLATLADEIWLQRTSEMGAVGMLSTTVFLRGAFDKFSAKADMGQRYEYKNAANVYTQTDYTPAHREATTRLMQSIYDVLTGDIAGRRKIDVAAFKALIDNGPYLTQGALDAKLVDKVGFWDDVEDAAKDRAGTGAEIVGIGDYYEREGSPYDHPYANDGTIALIAAEGAIVDGGSSESAWDGKQMGGDTIAAAIRDAAEDDGVKAILLRVNSPGGSALASDVILDQIRKAQAKGKKVIVSMGPVAASGGYWIAMYADEIFAMPATITGSIGVLSGKLIVGDTYRLAGLNPAQIGIGTNANFQSEFTEWTPEQRVKFEAGLDQIYNGFTQSVAEGRKIPIETVREIAKGRVWSGLDALGLKLIDQFGSLDDAIQETIKIAGLDANKRINVRLYPQVSAWDTFWASLGGVATTAERLDALTHALDSETAKMLLHVLSDGDHIEDRQIRMPREDIAQ